MTERSHKPERKDADEVRSKYDHGAEDEDGEGDETKTADSNDDGKSFFTDSGEAPEVLEKSLLGKDPSEVEALSRKAHEIAEEFEEVEVSVGRKEYLSKEVSEEAIAEGEEDGVSSDLDEEREKLESRVEEIEEVLGAEEGEEIREATERAEAARENPVLSLSDYRFETTRYFSLLEERFSKIGLEFDAGENTVEIEPGDWSVWRDDEAGTLVAEAESGRWRSKKTVKLQVQIHPEPDEFEDGTAVLRHDTNLGDSVTRFLRSDETDDYFVLVLATPVSVSDLPDEAVDRVRSAVGERKSITVVSLDDAEVVYNENDDTARGISKKELLNPSTHEAEVSRVSNALEDGMVSGDEMPADVAAEEFEVSEKVATKSFSEVAESESEFSVLTEKVPQPILVRW
jgi:hypothetical protein